MLKKVYSKLFYYFFEVPVELVILGSRVNIWSKSTIDFIISSFNF